MTLIRQAEVLEKCSFSRSTLYRLIESEDFPRPIRLSKRSVAWLEHEINAWIQRRIELSRPGRSGE